MPRLALTLILLLLAAAAQAITPARHGGGSSSGRCPHLQSVAETTPAVDAAAPVADSAAVNPQAEPTPAPAPAKPGSGVGRPKAPAPWHSFLPGMFK